MFGSPALPDQSKGRPYRNSPVEWRPGTLIPGRVQPVFRSSGHAILPKLWLIDRSREFATSVSVGLGPLTGEISQKATAGDDACGDQRDPGDPHGDGHHGADAACD